MDPILCGFALIAGGAAVDVVILWWRGRPWTAAVVAVVALLAATPLTRALPDAAIVAGLLAVLVTAAVVTVGPVLRRRRPAVSRTPEEDPAGRVSGDDGAGWAR